MAPVWIDLAALAVYGPMVILLHELGHAAFAHRGGYRVTDFAVGMGPPMWRVSVGRGVVVHVDRWVLLGGSCTAIPVGPPTARRAWFHAGGLLVQAALAAVLMPFAAVPVIQHVLAFNALVFVHNALPWRVGALASDGWHLLDTLSGHSRTANVLNQRAALERMTDRATQVESPLGEAYGRVCLAWVDVVAGEPDRADALFRDEPPAVTLDPWVDALYHYVKASWEQAGQRPLAALRTAREAHLHVDLSLVGDADALIALAEARALVDLDAPTQAQRVLARTAGVGGAIGWQAAAIHLWASLDDDLDTLEIATWRLVERQNESAYDPADGAMALWAASRVLHAGGRTEVARRSESAARSVAQRTLATAPVDLRASLVRRMGEVAGLGQRRTAATRR